MAECRYFPECQRCNETGDSWLPCDGGADGTRCEGYEPMPDVEALAALADSISDMRAYPHDDSKKKLCDVSFEMMDYIARRIRQAIGR